MQHLEGGTSPMARKATYPDWVSKCLEPGQYINKKGNSYYVYAAHSERREGVSHPVRVCDGYLGRITETEGFIPARKKGTAKPPESEESSFIPDAWDFGVPAAAVIPSVDILHGLNKSYRDLGTLIYICSILSLLHDTYSEELYLMSVLSLLFSQVSFPRELGQKRVMTGIQRGTRMVADKVHTTYGDDWAMIKAYLSTSVLTKSKRGYVIPKLPPTALALTRKYTLPVSRAEISEFLLAFSQHSQIS